jgi:hypothetical protein
MNVVVPFLILVDQCATHQKAGGPALLYGMRFAQAAESGQKLILPLNMRKNTV